MVSKVVLAYFLPYFLVCWLAFLVYFLLEFYVFSDMYSGYLGNFSASLQLGWWGAARRA